MHWKWESCISIQRVWRRERVQYVKIGHENPIKAIIYQWLLPHFQYRNLMRYVRFISWGDTQTRQSQGTLTLSHQQAAILNKPVGGKIWLRKDGYISGSTSLLITALMNESVRVSLSQQWNTATAHRQMAAEAPSARREAASHSNGPIRTWLTGSGQVETTKEANGGQRHGGNGKTSRFKLLTTTVLSSDGHSCYVQHYHVWSSSVISTFKIQPKIKTRAANLPWSYTSKLTLRFNKNTWCHFHSFNWDNRRLCPTSGLVLPKSTLYDWVHCSGSSRISCLLSKYITTNFHKMSHTKGI